ncbi:MAG TPA: single-stranded-DNA-specific exonuclease RecJ [Thermomicrobiales bacterium]
MGQSRWRWIEPEPLPLDAPRLHSDPLLNALLYRRQLRTPDEVADFLARHPRPAPDPWRLPAMRAAVDRIMLAIERGEHIAIFGDYDVDGVTSTALLTLALRAAMPEEARLFSRLPRREEGYGLNARAIEEFARSGVSLLITVDCGSTDPYHVALAREAGLDVVVLDHHHISDRVPDGATIVSSYVAEGLPYRELSAVGLAYLLVTALAQEGVAVGGPTGEPETGLLDLVALGTVADVAPLTGVNRALVRDGLSRIQRAPRPGIAALCRQAGVDPSRVTSEQIAYRLAPRLNAAGRMADPHHALRLLLTNDPIEAAELATLIDRLNQERRQRAQAVAEEAIASVAAQPGWEERRIVIARGQGWPHGVLGLVATRLVEEFRRPAIVLAEEEGVGRGSARSLAGINIIEAIERCSDLLTEWGGHSLAAGLTLPISSLPALAEALDAHLASAGVSVPVEPELRLEADLPIERLTLETALMLDDLQPFGAGNEAPVLRLRGVPLRQYDVVGQNNNHLRLYLRTPRGIVRAVAFGAAQRSRELLFSRTLDLAVTLNLDYWDGQQRLDVNVKDFRPSNGIS